MIERILCPMRLRILGAGLGVIALAALATWAGTSSASSHAQRHRYKAATFAMGHGNNVYAYWDRAHRDVPWIVYVHGGYWEHGSGRQANALALARHERSRGYAAFSVDYRLVPSVRWPTPENDVKTAVTWIRAHAARFGLDPAKGFIIGSSAGGLLASVAGLDLGGFAGVVSMAGAVDPYAFYRTAPNPTLRTASLALLDGRTPRQAPAAWQAARAATHLGRHRMPFLLMQSRGDATVPVSASIDFDHALRAAGYPVRLVELPGRTHSLTTASDTAIVDRWMATVLAKKR
jgi:acetyl esterase/lipase